ncbi:hypothetical protein [Sulfitobacter dubius]|uniref:hypothetical protein n=1 Tax=Sulfitobacter dubius TaxID=218673 RepID=UPI0022AF1F4A|nr:hypothetical protein [Sulfitobacter dubius]MCZ4368532.1 hypothetical protein [Sulfitobacter dubius]
MNTFKSALLGATALTAVASASYAAGGNESYTSQSGNDNTLAIEQIGGNLAGDSTPDRTITQNGNDNEIDLFQENLGGTNRIGSGAAIQGNPIGQGVDQIGDNNKLDVSQSGASLDVFDIQQTGGAANDSNITTITQTGSRQTVSNINQTFDGYGNSDANEITILQSGKLNLIGNTSSGPRSDGSGITQIGNGNSATVDQSGNSQSVYTLKQQDTKSGSGSNIATITQSGNVGTAGGSRVQLVDQYNYGSLDNTLSITQEVTGNGNNGKGAFSSDGPAALVTEVQLGNQSFAKQTGGGNDLTYSTEGEANKFGFLQAGFSNMIDSVSNGIGQEVAIRQTGSDNETYGVQTGSHNSAGIEMDGNRNFVDFSQDSTAGAISDGNKLAIMIAGHDNELTSTQTGLNNMAGLDVTGNRNHLDVDQRSAAGGNTMNVMIAGNDNNNYPTTNPLVGDADWARDSGLALSAMFSTLNQGDLSQNGDGNSLTLNVMADRNAFAMLQDGTNNEIVGEISWGSDNQAVVAQVGSNNLANFTIAGIGNVTGIVQH